MSATSIARSRRLQAPYPVNPDHAARQADRAAALVAPADFVHAVTRAGLLERLEPMTLSPAQVVDLGCRAGGNLPALEKRFRRARILGIDPAAGFVARARARQRWWSRSHCVRAALEHLPLGDHGVDLVFCNLALAAVDDPAALVAECARVLRKDGLFAFATLGPDSLGALRDAWAGVDDEPHVQRFPDMHDLGDLLVGAGLRDPVLDVDRLTLEYRSPAALFRDLTATAARNAFAGRRRTLTARGRFARMTTSLEAAAGAGPIRVELELVYGHCWGRGEHRRPGESRIPADAIPLRRR